MGTRGGARPRAGRPRGKANVVASAKSGEILQQLIDSGEATPLEVMLSIMTDAWRKKKTKVAMAAAIAAAPYVHPRLATTEFKGDLGKPTVRPDVKIFFVNSASGNDTGTAAEPVA